MRNNSKRDDVKGYPEERQVLTRPSIICSHVTARTKSIGSIRKDTKENQTCHTREEAILFLRVLPSKNTTWGTGSRTHASL